MTVSYTLGPGFRTEMPSIYDVYILYKSRRTSWLRQHTNNTHCIEPILKIQNKNSQKRTCAATVPISTFMYLWAIYILPQSICLFCCKKYVDRSREYINRSQTHECGNWDWGRAIPRKGIHKWDFRRSACFQLNCYLKSLHNRFMLPWDENGYGDDSRIRQLMPIRIVKYAVKLLLDYLSRLVNSWPSYLLPK